MKKIILALMFCLIATSAFAEGKAFQASLVPDVAIHSRDTRIEGFTLNIWGENPQSAFALGFVNGSTGESKGFSWGLVNYTQNYTGVEWGFVNYASGHFTGWQAGTVNYAGQLTGIQTGLLNWAKTSGQGGIQIGLINVVQDSQWFGNFPKELAPFFPFVNWAF